MSKVEQPGVFVVRNSVDLEQESVRLTKGIPCNFPANSLVSFESPVFMRLPQGKISSREKIPCYFPCAGKTQIAKALDRSPFADQIFTALRSDASAVLGSSRNVATFSRLVGSHAAIHHERHLAIENDVRRFCGMGVLRIVRTGPILPDVSLPKSF